MSVFSENLFKRLSRESSSLQRYTIPRISLRQPTNHHRNRRLFFDEGQLLCDSSLDVLIIQNYSHHSLQEPSVPKLSSAILA